MSHIGVSVSCMWKITYLTGLSRQESDVTAFKHGRPARKMPPVFGTAQPPQGVSDMLRRLAYKYPDH